MSFTIQGLFVGRPKPLKGTTRGMSSIARGQVQAPLKVLTHEIQGDEVQNKKHHGGPDRVLHQYPLEHYQYWKTQYPLSQMLYPSSIGENLTSIGLVESEVCVGDIYQIGSVVAQVTEPRKPCGVIDQHIEIKGLFKRVEKEYRCGWFYRILQEGEIDLDSSVKIIESGFKEFNLVEVMKKSLHDTSDRDYLERLSQYAPLSQLWRERVLKILNHPL